LGDDPPPDPSKMRGPAIWENGRAKSQVGIFQQHDTTPYLPGLQEIIQRVARSVEILSFEGAAQ
jgi:hypothetical protein